MAKPLNFDIIKGKPINQTKELKNNIDFIYNHILNILCCKNKEVNNYVLNFISSSFKGRKLRKALYLQSK